MCLLLMCLYLLAVLFFFLYLKKKRQTERLTLSFFLYMCPVHECFGIVCCFLIHITAFVPFTSPSIQCMKANTQFDDVVYVNQAVSWVQHYSCVHSTLFILSHSPFSISVNKNGKQTTVESELVHASIVSI